MKFFSLAPTVIREEIRQLPVGYLDDVMLFQDFAQAWQTFKDSEDKEKLAQTHPLFEVCREIWYGQNLDLVRKRRKAEREKSKP